MSKPSKRAGRQISRMEKASAVWGLYWGCHHCGEHLGIGVKDASRTEIRESAFELECAACGGRSHYQGGICEVFDLEATPDMIWREPKKSDDVLVVGK